MKREESRKIETKVVTAWHALKAQGQDPTVRGVQAEVGDYSVSTIQKYLGRIKAKEVPTTPGPEDVFKPLLKAASDVVRSELSKETETISGQLESLKIDHEKLSRDLEKVRAEKDEAMSRLADQERLAATLTFEVKVGVERLAAASSEIEKLRTELAMGKMWREDCQKAVKEAKEARNKAAKLEGRLDGIESERRLLGTKPPAQRPRIVRKIRK